MEKQYDSLVRKLICEIINEKVEIVSLAIQNKNKFEGWLKFELANKLVKLGLREVTIETKYERRKDRYDLTFMADDYYTYYIELKTPNTNWNIDGVKRCKRPITKNINSIIEDTKKLNSKNGIVAFVLFPIPKGDNRWKVYLNKIQEECGLQIEAENNCNKITIAFDNQNNECDLVVCSYFSKEYYWHL